MYEVIDLLSHKSYLIVAKLGKLMTKVLVLLLMLG